MKPFRSDAEPATSPLDEGGRVHCVLCLLCILAGAQLRLGLHGCNRPAQTMSPPLRGFLAQQILCASRSSTYVAAASGAARPSPA